LLDFGFSTIGLRPMVSSWNANDHDSNFEIVLLGENAMPQTAAFTLLNAATATGDGSVFNLEFPQLAAAVQAEISGSPTQAVINVMALLNGGTWDTLAVLDTNQGYLSGEIATISYPAPIRQIKGNLGTLTGGTSPSVSLYFTARG
jgi:hypothetical protein